MSHPSGMSLRPTRKRRNDRRCATACCRCSRERRGAIGMTNAFLFNRARVATGTGDRSLTKESQQTRTGAGRGRDENGAWRLENNSISMGPPLYEWPPAYNPTYVEYRVCSTDDNPACASHNQVLNMNQVMLSST